MTDRMTEPANRPATAPSWSVAVWLGNAPPVRSIRWLDGALKAGAKFGAATAVAAGAQAWLDLAADRAARLGLASVGVPTDLSLDYLGWAQVMAAVARKIGATTILVDEASRPERFAEVAALAELTDTAQLTHVVALAPDATAIHASRAAGTMLQTVRIHGPAVIGVRIAGPPIEEYPTPTPSASMRRLELTAIGLDPAVLGHRALPPRATQHARRTVDRIADHLAVHMAPDRDVQDPRDSPGGRTGPARSSSPASPSSPAGKDARARRTSPAGPVGKGRAAGSTKGPAGPKDS
ncbi:MAG TPA: hypothetical protein VFT22_23020 [Kofleriaceae bacterium]|nr:hypothetical protein [Kofleriaceae bacterium]